MNKNINTEKLQSFSNDLRNEFKKFTDALFIDNLIAAINSHPSACKLAVNQWLKAAFDLPANCDNDNCIDVYNRSFYHSILEKI